MIEPEPPAIEPQRDDLTLNEVRGLEKSIRMLEADSYDRLVHGLRTASEGARDIAARGDGMWDVFGDTLDKVRLGMVRVALRGGPADGEPTKRRRGSDPTMQILPSYQRVYNGLDAAAKASRQMATGHRMDLRWSKWAATLETLRDKASLMIRRQVSERTGLVLH